MRLSEAIQRDMVQVRLTDSFRFVVVGAPEYLKRHGTPQRPEDLLRHECITFRSPTTGALYAWELERGRRTWRVPVRGGLVVRDDAQTIDRHGGAGLGPHLHVRADGPTSSCRPGASSWCWTLTRATVPGFFIYFPSRAQRSGPLRLFVDAVKELALRRLK